MKIGIITFHRAVNYGAVLQAYALQTMIQKLGADVEILDYRCPYLEDNYNPIKILGRASNIKGFLGILVKVFPSAVKKKRSFDRFLKDHLNISKERYDRNSVYQSNQVYDIFITGSDQVWNYNHTNFDKSFFLNFVKDSSKKTAYAASLGFGSLPDKYVEEYRNLLSDFRAISVREKSAQQILKDILKKEVQVMPDPVFLLDKEEWDRIIPLGQAIKDKYILVYELMPSESLFKFALKLQHETGYKIIRISTKKQKMNNVIFRGTDRPETFLNYIKNAELVVTNSFHETVFSIIFNKQFLVEYLKDSMSSLNSRISDLLRDYGLGNRVIGYDEMYSQIDYAEVNAYIMRRRTESEKFIKELLEG